MLVLVVWKLWMSPDFFGLEFLVKKLSVSDLLCQILSEPCIHLGGCKPSADATLFGGMSFPNFHQKLAFRPIALTA